MSAPTTSPAQAPPPDVSIRTRPPSPKRLSRKVLMLGAAIAGTVITAALLLGLTPQQHRSAADQQAQATANGPPETIAQASSQYDAANFVRPQTDVPQLEPPQDLMWANAQPGPGAPPTAGGASPSTATTAPTRDPETIARTAPILFASATSPSTNANDRDAGEARLDTRLIPPRSRYEIQSGSVIPAALVTGLNSDLAGRVIAQVTAPVYDSVTGDHLLIPQGARLIGTYENGVRYGDHRILLVWNRLILPNGWSMNLQQMSASDPTGASGLQDQTDNHLGSLAGAVGLSAIISVIGSNSEDGGQSNNRQSLSQSIGEAAAQQAAQTGSQIVQRELTVHPTLRVRPGANVRVLVTRDIELRPYR
jgi:type IV secretory pathway VirB10-like protein